MKSTTSFFFLILLLTLNSCNSQSIQNNYKTISILFVGNSLTYTNNLPEIIKQKAKTGGIDIAYTMLAKPNYAIVDHWNEGKVQELIETKTYDYLILQQGPSSQQDGYKMLVEDGQLFKNLCLSNNTTLVYFMVWPSLKYYNTFDDVITNYTAGAKTNNAILCPVGRVWKEHIDTSKDTSLYGYDGFHPSLNGSNVAAKVILKSIFKERYTNE